MEKENEKYCTARQINGEEWLYVGGDYVHEENLQHITYRWINEGADNEQFQILFNDEWCDAQSIDFEFYN